MTPFEGQAAAPRRLKRWWWRLCLAVHLSAARAPVTRPAAPLGALAGAGAFARRQQRDWIVTVVRPSLDRLPYQSVFPSLSLFLSI